MSIITLGFLLLFGFSGTPSHQEGPESILRKAAEVLERHKSMSYTSTYRFKSFSGDDTLTLSASCELFRDPDDSVFGGYIRFRDPGPWAFATKMNGRRIGEGEERVYDGRRIFYLSRDTKSATVFDVQEHGESPMTGNILFGVVSLRFLKPSRITDLLHPENILTLPGDAMIDGHACWKIVARKPDTDEFTDNVSELFVRKDTWWIVKSTARVTFQENQQYQEWTFANLSFDTLSREHFTEFRTPEGYRVSEYEYKNPGEERYKPLENDIQAPEFTGVHFQTGGTISLSAYKGKTVLLDFWYMACYPCIKAIPALIELQNMYADSGLVILGINSRDDDEKHKARLPDFLRINKVNYPVILASRAVDDSYRVKVYPTLYIIDREGNILHSQLGHGDGTKAALQAVIEREIRR